MTTNVSRRAVVLGLGSAAVLAPLFAGAQGRRPARVGFVSWFTPTETAQIEPLREALRELGWTEGRNLELEVHFTAGRAEPTREILHSLVKRQFDVIVVRATNAAHLAKEATRTTPIVMLVSDPLATGLVRSLARPEANLTGLSLQGPDLAGKRLEYLRAIMPNVRTVAFLGAANDPNVSTFVRETQAAADLIGVALRVRLVPGTQAYGEQDFSELAAQGVSAVLVQPIFTGQQVRIVDLAMRHRIAVISNYAVFAKAGALLTLGPDDAALTRRAGYFVDRLLKGAKPGDLPVEQPSRFTLAVNLAAARALGLVVPSGLMVSADTVIE
jgi:putative ABC transport system substrate-binding protein